jgi:hypothetical protein
MKNSKKIDVSKFRSLNLSNAGCIIGGNTNAIESSDAAAGTFFIGDVRTDECSRWACDSTKSKCDTHYSCDN